MGCLEHLVSPHLVTEGINVVVCKARRSAEQGAREGKCVDHCWILPFLPSLATTHPPNQDTGVFFIPLASALFVALRPTCFGRPRRAVVVDTGGVRWGWRPGSFYEAGDKAAKTVANRAGGSGGRRWQARPHGCSRRHHEGGFELGVSEVPGVGWAANGMASSLWRPRPSTRGGAR